MDDEEKQDLAIWRLGVLGPLISARLEHGDRQRYFTQAASRTHQMPDGRHITLSPRTIESWYYSYKNGGLKGLMPGERSDRGRSRAINAEVADLIIRAKNEKPRRSIRRIIRMLERARVVRQGELSRSSVHRLLQARGLSGRPVRGPAAERRSFLVEHGGDLWMGDAMHGPRVLAPNNSIKKSYLLTQFDGATRYVPHSYFALSEDAVAHEHGLRQAICKYGLPRTYYVDRGAAYRARSLRLICAELGIRHVLCDPGDCEAKGGIERWHRTWREEVGDELPEHPIPLADLNAIHWAWLATEYHRRKHETTGRIPLEHWLAEAEYLRPVGRDISLREVFLHRVRRTVRKDGTVRFRGQLLEVRADLTGPKVELRFDPASDDPDELPRVFVGGRFVCDTVRLDRYKNATRRRRRHAGKPTPDAPATGLNPLAQIQAEHYDRTRPLDNRHRQTPDDQDK